MIEGIQLLIESIEHGLLAFIEGMYNAVGWPGVIVMMAIESACIPLPSELIMPLSGWMLIKAKGLSVWYTLLAGFYGAIGNTIGSAIAYGVGKYAGRTFILRYGKYILISAHDLDRADRWFQKYGVWAAFISRLLPVVRTFISFPAGVSRMNFPLFLLFTFLGALPFSWALAYAGYLMGEHWETVRRVMRPFDIPIIAAILVLVGLYVYRHIKLVRQSSAGEEASKRH